MINLIQKNLYGIKKKMDNKIFRCRESVGGIYYSIYSDNNKTGIPSAEDSLKDPLSQKKKIFIVQIIVRKTVQIVNLYY